MFCLVIQKTCFPLFLSMQLSPNCDTASKRCKVYGTCVHTTCRQDVRRKKFWKASFSCLGEETCQQSCTATEKNQGSSSLQLFCLSSTVALLKSRDREICCILGACIPLLPPSHLLLVSWAMIRLEEGRVVKEAWQWLVWYRKPMLPQMMLKDGYQHSSKICGNFAFTKCVGAGSPLLEEKKPICLNFHESGLSNCIFSRQLMWVKSKPADRCQLLKYTVCWWSYVKAPVAFDW